MKNLMQTSVKLYECRDTMKALLGDKYKDRMAQWGEQISAVMRLKNCDEIMAAVEMAKKAAEPMVAISLLAAAVEMVEPS